MTLSVLIRRNTKLFFKDKGMFFTSLITPMILLVLYATFLGNIYKDSFFTAMPEGLPNAEALINGCVGGQLISSILSVSCVTVAFCSNMLMVQDKANGTIKDLTISPVKPHILALSYYIASFAATLIICFTATALCLAYVGVVGFYMSASDILFLLLDVVLLVLFGTALSSVINFFLSTQGQISAVGSIVSSCYGFICGAYMPISQFSDGLQNALLFLPGTYGTSLVRHHAMRGVFAEMAEQNYPEETVRILEDIVDCNLYFFENEVTAGAKYAVLFATVAVLIAVYVLLHALRSGKAK